MIHRSFRKRCTGTIPALAAALLALVGCSGTEANPADNLSLREKIAQKLMLDVRYYCAESAPAGVNAVAEECRTPVTELPPALEKLIAQSGVGGIVLFADNLEDSAQIVRLNSELQAAAAHSRSRLPLLIGVDQEGGRVNRLPREEAVAFAGNMAIGATYPRHGDQFAAATAAAMAEQMRTLGFNVNFAPTLDVNSNPENPVINVRSYSEDPAVVADLGAASVKAFQAQQIAATIKHFPGHGDTAVDSHTGLPRVERSAASARAVDLLPFGEVIRQASPALAMTAHIQYPALDDTELTAENGEKILVPATLSRKILTDLLRGELGFRGVIVTDALDMAGISHYFSIEDAVVKTFAAGADIALMPVKIRYPQDLQKLDRLIDAIAAAVQRGELAADEIDTSVERILALKKEYVDSEWIAERLQDKQVAAHRVLASREHRALALQLANAALSPIFQPQPGTLPVLTPAVKKIQVVAPSVEVGEAFSLSLGDVSDAQIEVLDPYTAVAELQASPADVLLVASIVPGESAVERGGMDDLAQLRRAPMSVAQLYGVYRQCLQLAQSRGQKTVFISMRSPYEAAYFNQQADLFLASFDYKAYIGRDAKLHGPIYRALADALQRKQVPPGTLPVTVQQHPLRAATTAGH